jgi:hypothetical protein
MLNILSTIDGPSHCQMHHQEMILLKNCRIEHKRSKPLKRVCPIVVVAFTEAIIRIR